ncbi:methyltransferase domain-containing protein [Bradyrhizobium lablabi]|nr:class I SAM-dependent methyltransferase [Bradyrhizobium lablabi]MBR1121090.1 methyltransferase domain-containing protein [Bradyrhizobium lablabi]
MDGCFVDVSRGNCLDRLVGSEGRLESRLILICPRCKARVSVAADRAFCTDSKCIYAGQGFPVVDGQPVLIDFLDSIFQRSNYKEGNGSAIARDPSRSGLRSRLHRFVDGDNPVAVRNCRSFLALIKAQSRRPRVLVIGGGSVGKGAEGLYRDPDIELIGTDVYASSCTDLLCDAHKLPFEDSTFDGVWVQAVLEHVLDPHIVVSEIHRVLRKDGLIYAETPFMQQVHERAYDFTRFTPSGHRWLFRRFEEIAAGPVTGPGVALVWSIRYLLRSLGMGEKISRLIAMLFVWIRWLDRFCQSRMAADAAGGVFFLGRRSESALSAASMVSYYEDS